MNADGIKTSSNVIRVYAFGKKNHLLYGDHSFTTYAMLSDKLTSLTP